MRLLFDDLVGAGEDQGRDRQADAVGGFQIDNEFEFRGLINRDVAWFGSAEHLAQLIRKLSARVVLTGLALIVGLGAFSSVPT